MLSRSISSLVNSMTALESSLGEGWMSLGTRIVLDCLPLSQSRRMPRWVREDIWVSEVPYNFGTSLFGFNISASRGEQRVASIVEFWISVATEMTRQGRPKTSISMDVSRTREVATTPLIEVGMSTGPSVVPRQRFLISTSGAEFSKKDSRCGVGQCVGSNHAVRSAVSPGSRASRRR